MDSAQLRQELLQQAIKDSDKVTKSKDIAKRKEDALKFKIPGGIPHTRRVDGMLYPEAKGPRNNNPDKTTEKPNGKSKDKSKDKPKRNTEAFFKIPGLANKSTQT